MVSMVPWQALIDDAMKELPIGMEEAKRCQERIIRLGWGLSFPTLKRLGDKPLGARCLGAVQKFGFSGCGMLERWIFRLILVHEENVGNKILALRRFRTSFGTLPLSTLDFWIPTPDFFLVVWTGWFQFESLLRSPGFWTGFAFASLDGLAMRVLLLSLSSAWKYCEETLLSCDFASFALIQPDVCHLSISWAFVVKILSLCAFQVWYLLIIYL